ncbi:MAG: hypothetical protein U0694_01975 [Anaerolineae bacterium]
MQPSTRSILHWTPRLLALLFILFISMFALDVFGEYASITDTAIALFMHLIPSLLLAGALLLAWRWRVPGGLLFLALGLISVFYWHTGSDLLRFVMFSLPIIVVGALFILDERLALHPPALKRPA